MKTHFYLDVERWRVSREKVEEREEKEEKEREEEKNLQIAIRCLWDLFD